MKLSEKAISIGLINSIKELCILHQKEGAVVQSSACFVASKCDVCALLAMHEIDFMLYVFF